MRINIITRKVLNILTKKPELRDSDDKLAALIWFHELKEKGISHETAYQIARIIGKGELTSFESISRSRRKVQEEYPELRGKLYAKRQGRQKDVRLQLGYNH